MTSGVPVISELVDLVPLSFRLLPDEHIRTDGSPKRFELQLEVRVGSLGSNGLIFDCEVYISSDVTLDKATDVRLRMVS